MPGQRPVNGDFTMIGAERPANLDQFVALTVAEMPVVVDLCILPNDDTAMPAQRLWRLGVSRLRQVGRRRAQQAAIAGGLRDKAPTTA